MSVRPISDPPPVAEDPIPEPRPDKGERQKRALQRLVISTLAAGASTGLQPEQVLAVDVGLRALGWIPEELKV